MNGTPPKLSFEITKSSEITKLISDGIRAAEALEESLLRNQSIISAPPTHLRDNNISNNNNDNIGSRIPSKPLLAPARPEILHGETHSLKPSSSSTASAHSKLPIFAAPQSPVIVNSHLHQRLQYPHLHHTHYPFPHPHHYHAHTALQLHHNLTSNLPALAQKTISLSEYLRPPQNAPLFHPVKLPGRRPFPGPIKKVPASRPVLPQQHPPPGGLLPQSSLIVNHYRKPVPSLLKPFLKEKLFPIQPIAASVLLLGQPTELNGIGQRKTDAAERAKIKSKPVIPLPVPYVDLEPQASLKATSYFKSNTNVEKPVLSTTTTTTIPIIKRPVPEEPSPQQIASMRPAINQGFKPDSVVVESGFRPIVRNDGTGVQLPPELIDQVAHRREDPGSEIDEVMETDTLFLTAQQSGSETQSFEPMFIPSPLDSTNATMLALSTKEEVVDPLPESPSPLRLPSVAIKHALPEAAELRKPSLEELFLEGEEDDVQSEAVGQDKRPTSTNKPTIIEKKQGSSETAIGAGEDLDYDDVGSLFEPSAEEEHHMQDSLADDLQMEPDEKIAEAAERIDTYYLPPDNRKIPQAGIPSGAVYTFDGKSVVDATLVLPPKLDARDSGHSRHTHYGLTPLEKLIRTTPQFGAYRGDLPEDFLSTTQAGVRPVTDYTSPGRLSSSSTDSTLHSHSSPLLTSSLRPISTKLHLLKPNINDNST
ncbi:protein Skeletor, isoforms D/E-like [Drosophila hydei]|uniref:Protein Skeletor, isoforms D/E-like n=1 Tax=Drosophila hydei TaxID=7224 RepID=A0A6J2T070_DROHY|nr:protein Skeletor, isoforms D/E-like [Drosophila hydei]